MTPLNTIRIFRSAVIALILLASVVIPVSAYTVYPWCADQDVFFWNASSDISGYRIMDQVPEKTSQKTITTVPFTVSDGDVTVGQWITPAGSPGALKLAPGLWRFRVYAYTSLASGTTVLKFYVVNRSASGAETRIYYGAAATDDISTSISFDEHLLSYARHNCTQFNAGDRLIIRINASTDSASARTVSLSLADNTNTSMVSISYFMCNNGPNAIYINKAQSPMEPAIAVCGIVIVSVLVLRRRRT